MPEITSPLNLPDARVIADSGSANPDGQIVVVTANGTAGLEYNVIDVRGEAPDAFPPRAAGNRTVTDQASFIHEVSDRPLITTGSNVRSTVWANRNRGTVKVVYDDHQADATSDYADRLDTLTLQFVEHPDWPRFLKAADAQFHDQETFADLIESVGHLITSHPAAELMEIVGSIRASSKGSFESKPNRANGSMTFTYSEEVSAKAGTRSRPLEIPTEVTFNVARFEDYPEIEITCWLRFRIRGEGELSLTLVPQPYEHRIQASWIDVVEHLADTIEHPIYAANL
ncbi:DUF2303 family protein [Gordonia sp. SND2]|uniref:DUF2303 family protein n=1 Tax=Gordonia sp. SND2 TaxID=3388659 RepID=UPI00398ADF2F